jgi:hypothetical protein
MPVKHLPRPRIQRTFVRWFEKNRCNFEIPIQIKQITAKNVKLVFSGLQNILSVSVSAYELNVYVNWQGQMLDVLISLDVYMRHTPDGYKCKCCCDSVGATAAVFTSREALWRDHLFIPFLKWVNEKLANAHWLEVSSMNDGGITWARLVNDESAPNTINRGKYRLHKSINCVRFYECEIEEGVSSCFIELTPKFL